MTANEQGPARAPAERATHEPEVAGRKPVGIELEAGKDYFWCACGRSAKQPFCDGSHRGTSFAPLAFSPDADGRKFLCLCKHTNNPPYCDGSHNAIADVPADVPADHPADEPGAQDTGTRAVWYRVADVDALAEREVRAVQAGARTIALTRMEGRYGALDNACTHQGGPLGEGTIECDEDGACWLRCPWHGWDFDPLTGASPGGHDDAVATFPVEVRDDGVYVEVIESTARTRTTSDVMAETMVRWGVTHVFGMVGHSNLGLADAIRVREAAGDLTFIGIRHEGAAAFACSGYAKLTGLPAACLTIAGPGATNLLTGLWDAKVDRAPVLALTGQVNTQVFGPGAFQEIDLASAFAAVSSFSQTVLPDSRHAELMTLALKHAVVERGVAHLIYPDEVQVIPAPADAGASAPDGRIGAAEIAPPASAVAAAVERIGAARRPAIIVGFGARSAMGSIVALAEHLGAPVLTTFKAKGLVPDRHPLAAGVLGRSGTPVASAVMNEADLLIVFGASFSNHTGIEASKPIVQVDFDRMALGRFHPVEVPVWGEVGVTAHRLLEASPARADTQGVRDDLARRWRQWREEKARRAGLDRGEGIASARLFEVLSRVCPEDAVIAVDVGNNTYSFGRYFECARQSVLMSGYLGSIGFGFPAAMGAWAATQALEAHRGRAVVSVSGDGGFGQYMGEFTTAVKYGMNITHVLLNNSELGKISKEQRAGSWEVWQTGLHNPGFAEFAHGCGGHGVRVERADDLERALTDALAHEGPALVEIMTDAELI